VGIASTANQLPLLFWTACGEARERFVFVARIVSINANLELIQPDAPLEDFDNENNE
jgi:hypothetical protein